MWGHPHDLHGWSGSVHGRDQLNSTKVLEDLLKQLSNFKLFPIVTLGLLVLGCTNERITILAPDKIIEKTEKKIFIKHEFENQLFKIDGRVVQVDPYFERATPFSEKSSIVTLPRL